MYSIRGGNNPTCVFSISTFAGSLVWISLSYSGFNAAVYVAGEARDGARTVPAALLRATLAVTAIYLALNAVFVGFAPYAEVAGSGPRRRAFPVG